LVMLLYCEARKNDMTARVLSARRQINNETLLDISDILFL
jgi:hypothetical protein